MKKILITLLILISVIASYAPATYAQDEPTDTNCVTEMKPFMETKSTELRTYFKEHFQSKKTNSSLLDLALKRFDKYKKELTDKMMELSPQAGLSLYSESIENLKCAKKMNEEITIMEKLLRSYFEQTAQVKKTSALMNKLKEINKKMDAMMKAVMQMYGKYMALKGRIPCLIKECL
ncbi:hypothetical protein ACFL3T_00255 [Patescibacteria group bacterium]